VAWDYAQYAWALLRMGHDVYYIEDSGEWPYNLEGSPTGTDLIAQHAAPTVRQLGTLMERLGLDERWAYRFPLQARWFGMSDERRAAVVKSADLLINVSGTLERPHEYRSVKRLAYIDSDPVFTQIKLISTEDHAFRSRVSAHDAHFTFGESLDHNRFQDGHTWLPTRQPILLDEWRPSRGYRDVYTTVMNWTSYAPVHYRGSTYGQKDVEFARFLDFPSRVSPVRLEVAVGGVRHAKWEHSGPDASGAAPGDPHGQDTSVSELLCRHGWSVVDPFRTCGNLDDYRQYIESSKGEWSVAKNGYVLGRSGWFSCRSACYLAAGRPVVIQDTGFGNVIPTGLGVLAFSTPEEAAEGLRDVESRYERHARAAREIAEAFFESSRILNRLIEQVMTCTPHRAPTQVNT
jgi:hypothetical protein